MKLISNSGRERALDELKSWPTEGSTIDVMSPSFSVHAFDAVADQLNGRPRMTLGWRKPIEVYAEHLARLTQQPDSIH